MSVTIIERIKANKRVHSFSEETLLDGYVVCLKSGWCCDGPGNHLIREETATRCWDKLRKGVEPCFCEECREVAIENAELRDHPPKNVRDMIVRRLLRSDVVAMTLEEANGIADELIEEMQQAPLIWEGRK